MNLRQSALLGPKVVKIVTAVIVGFSLGTAVPPKSVTPPVVGPVSGIAVGGFGLLVGAVLHLRVPPMVGASDCGCGEECGCS